MTMTFYGHLVLFTNISIYDVMKNNKLL